MKACFCIVYLIMFCCSQVNASDLCRAPQNYYRGPRIDRPYEEGYLPTSGGEVFYQYIDRSYDRPLIILFPGLPAATYLSSFASDLSAMGYSVLILDYPGKMNSKLQGTSSLQFIESQFIEVFKKLQIYKHNDWHLVGVSMGGVIASRMAALAAPTRVRSLVLMNPVGLKGPSTLSQKVAVTPGLSKLAAPLVMKSEVRKNISSSLGCPERYRNLLDEQDQYLRTVSSRLNYVNLIGNYALQDSTQVYRELREIKIPILLVGGSEGEDTESNRDQLDRLKRILPMATAVSIKNTSHFPFIESPFDTLFELISFYRSHFSR